MSGVFAHQQVKHLLAEGVEVRVVTAIPWAPRVLWSKTKWQRMGMSPTERLYEGVKVYYPRYLEMPGHLNFCWSGMALLAGIRGLISKIYKEFPFELIHANTIVPDGYAATRLARQYGVPVLCVSRGDLNIYPHYGPLSMAVSRYVLRECDKLVTVSADLANVARSMEPGIRKPVSVLYNGCDFEKFIPANEKDKCVLRDNLGLPPDKIILFLLGAIEVNKGIYELAAVFEELVEKWGEKIMLLMIGSGKDEHIFIRHIKERKLEKHIHFTGYVDHERVPDWVRAGDVMVFPTHYEGVPNAVLESMACAKPVVATSVGGIPEIIQDRETGYLVPLNDKKSLYDAVDNLLEDPDCRQRVGKAALTFLHSHASWPQNARQLKKIYLDTIVEKATD